MLRGAPSGDPALRGAKLVSSRSLAVREAPALDTVVGELARSWVRSRHASRSSAAQPPLDHQEEFEGAVRLRLVHDILVPVAVRSRRCSEGHAPAAGSGGIQGQKPAIPDAAGIMTFRLFLSTSGDAAGEREVVLRLCQRLGEAYAGKSPAGDLHVEDFSGKVSLQGGRLKDSCAAGCTVIPDCAPPLPRDPPLADKTFAAGFLDELFQIAREQHTRHGRPYLDV